MYPSIRDEDEGRKEKTDSDTKNNKEEKGSEPLIIFGKHYLDRSPTARNPSIYPSETKTSKPDGEKYLFYATRALTVIVVIALSVVIV